jgi:[ribosomal protein S5]-alanine N-acetyltransferase
VTEVPTLIEGARLRLRRVMADDAPTLFSLVDDADVMRYMDWPRPSGVHETRAFLQNADERWWRGQEHQYMVVHKAEGVALGTASFRPRGHAVDFGYVFGRAHWGQGHASEAAQLLVGWLRRQGSVLRIWATCDADNLASARVLAKAGLLLEGRLKRATARPNLGGAVRDNLLYAWARPEES